MPLKSNLESLGLPPHLLSILEGAVAVPPQFPGDVLADTNDLRIVPGGPSSSELLRIREELLREDVYSLVQEVIRVRQRVNSTSVLLNGLSPVVTQLSSTLNSLQASSGLAGGVIDFFQPGNGWVNSSTCIYDSIWGQATLPFASAPQSQIIRPQGFGARPGTVVGFTRNYVNGTAPNYQYDETDPDAFHMIDGRFDTSWSVPVSGSQQLAISITLPPTLGASSKVNSLSLLPWPFYGCEITQVWVRNGVQGGSIPGWTQLSLAGQVNYNPSTQTIKGAGACRFFFSASPVREVLVVLKPLPGNPVIGMTYLDVTASEFQAGGVINLDAGQVGVTSIAKVVLMGLNPSQLTNIPVSVNGSQITLDLSSASPDQTPVLTAVGAVPVPPGQQNTGFDISVWSP